MEIAFRVRGVEVPEPLRRVTEAKVIRLAEPCGIDRAVVCFSEERNSRIAEREVCQITLFGSGPILRAHAAAADVRVAAERVVSKLEQRAERFRGRRLGRRPPRWCGGVVSTAAGGDGWVHFPANRSTARREPGAVDLVVTSAEDVTGTGVRVAGAELMTPEEAALEMSEWGRDILFFVNAETGRPAVVYCRTDGDIALYDTGTSRVAPEVVT